MSEEEVEEAEGAEETEEAEEAEEPEGDAVVLLDPLAEPEIIAAIEAAIGHSVRVLDPLPLDPDLPGPGDLAIVVPLDLGSVSGIDLVESLRVRAQSEAFPIAVTSPEPTRRRVRAALRAGATTWLRQPYDAEDWQQRLAPHIVESAEQPGDTADAAEPSEEESEEASA